MANVDDLQKEHEAKLSALLAELGAAAPSPESALVRALVHRGATWPRSERPSVCGLATFLGEMIVHAHQIIHGGDKTAPAHRDVVH